jgi:hypothetical protein
VCLAALIAAVGCTSTSSPARDRTARPTSLSVPAAHLGQHRFVLDADAVTRNRPLTIGLHPDRTSIEVLVASAGAFEVCPATDDGRVVREGSWPSTLGFHTCRPMTSSELRLPATDGSLHVFFAIRPAHAPSSPVTATISYRPADSFTMVLPSSEVRVGFRPLSGSIAAQAYLAPDFGTDPRLTARATQDGAKIVAPAQCDFPTEIDCIGPATADEPVEVSLHPPAALDHGPRRPALYLGWR